jgi:hypothetical protein
MDEALVVEAEELVLAVGLGPHEPGAGEILTSGEAALRRGHLNELTLEKLLVIPSVSMDGMTFGHRLRSRRTRPGVAGVCEPVAVVVPAEPVIELVVVAVGWLSGGGGTSSGVNPFDDEFKFAVHSFDRGAASEA